MNLKTNDSQSESTVNLKPNLKGFLIAYIVFSVPGFIAALLWTLISFFVLIGVIFASSGLSQEETAFEYNIIKQGNSDQRILVYNLNGPISTGNTTTLESNREFSIYTTLVQKDLNKIKEDKTIKNVVFRMNTPGGEASASKVLGDIIADTQGHYNQQESVFYFDRINASGGLIAAYKNKNFVVGSPYGRTGSIGVLLTLPNFSGAAEKIGYSETVIKSSESKDIGNPLREISSSEKTHFQNMVDKEYNTFKNIVAQGRNLEASQVDQIANGLVYFNDEARELGLIDQIGDLEIALKKSADNAGLASNYQAVEIKTSLGAFDNFLSSQTLSDILALPKATSQVVDRALFFKAGTIYYIDEYSF
jgi:protease-4